MNHAIRLSLVAAIATALAACGGGAKLAPGKQNAAAAAFMSSQGAHGAGGSIFDLARQNASFGVDATFSCTKSGKVTIHYQVDTTDSAGALSFVLKYASCSYNGTTTLDGDMTVHMNASVTSTSVSGQLTLDGQVNFSGDIHDFVKATHLTETLDISKLASGNGIGVSVKLNGTVQTSSQTYSYSDETFSVTTGHLEADTSGGKS